MDNALDKTFDAFEALSLPTVDDLFKDYALAGGAVRDMLLLNEQAIKDLDIYVQVDKREYMRHQHHYATFFRDKFNAYCNTSEYKGLENNPILSVWTTRDMEIQMILLDHDIEDYIGQYFDIGICEVYMDKTGNLKGSTNFINDRADKVVKVRPKYNLSYWTIGKAISEHLPRVAKKYPSYNQVIGLPELTHTPVRFENV